jgi:hypothetical protein
MHKCAQKFLLKKAAVISPTGFSPENFATELRKGFYQENTPLTPRGLLLAPP